MTRILVVDDVADNRELYEIALRNAGYEVVTAETAELGIEIAFTGEAPALVIMDHHLPGLDGCEATRILKRDPRTAHVLVVMVTGHAIESIEQLARDCGADDFRSKPLKPSDLVALVRALLTRT